MIAATTNALDAAASLVAAGRAGRRDRAAEDRLAALDPTALAVALADPAPRLAFWLNVYNGAVRARLLQDPEAYRRRWRFFSASAITVAGRRLSPNAIEHGILRRSAFALSLGYVRIRFHHVSSGCIASGASIRASTSPSTAAPAAARRSRRTTPSTSTHSWTPRPGRTSRARRPS